MRRIIATIMTLILTISCLASCGTKPEGVEPEAESKGKDLISIYSGIANGEASKNVDRNTFKVGELSKKYTFGYVAGNLGSAYFYVGPNATKDYLESLGCTCLISDANADLATQVSQIENFITQAVDAIIINSVDPPSGVSEALQKAAEAGIPVVAVDSFLSDEFTNYLAFVGSDNFKLGYECGVYAANYMLKTKGAVEGKVCVLDGVEGNAAATGRYDGFWAGVESVAPEHKLEEVSRLYGGGWTEEAGIQMAEDMLVAQPYIDIMFGISDPFVTGAMTATARVGRSEMLMCAVDGQKAALKLLKDGTNIKCIAGQDPTGMGLIAANLLLSFLEDGTLPESRILRITPVVATPENINEIYDANAEF